MRKLKSFGLRHIGKFLLLFCLLAVAAWPQTPASVLLTWTASTTPNVTYNVMHSATATGTFTVVNQAPIATTTYTDAVNTGGYWYVVSVDSAGDISVPSTTVTLPNPPSALKVVGN